MRAGSTFALWMAAGALTVLWGCRVDSSTRGKNENVKVATPFGGLSVKTNGEGVTEGIGLPTYPGAELVRKGTKSGEDGAADVNMSFGSFHLRVNVVSYRTADAPGQVTAFYRKALERYGEVLQCSDHKAVGTPVRTAEGLTCEEDGSNVRGESGHESSKFELKAGSKQRQHVVSIEPEGTGTKFGLIALQLPGHLGADQDGSSQ